MADLKDYSVAFNPDLKLEDFNKVLLVQMWHIASMCFILRMGGWIFPIIAKSGKVAFR